MSKPILCLDFDGVIHSYKSGWQGADTVADPPVTGAMEFIMGTASAFEVNIFSSRSHQQDGIHAMQRWLEHYLQVIMLWSEREAYEFVTKQIVWPAHKPPAMITIDDRAITFTGEWPTIQELFAFKPWNKR